MEQFSVAHLTHKDGNKKLSQNVYITINLHCINIPEQQYLIYTTVED